MSEEGGYGALASRFARRVSELESQVAAARAQCSAAREEATETARQERALRGRVAHLTRALERSRGGGEYDAEYVHNVMLNWLLLSDEERTPLLPVRRADLSREDSARFKILPRRISRRRLFCADEQVLGTIFAFSAREMGAVTEADAGRRGVAGVASWLWGGASSSGASVCS